jgi:hypothetical protein
VAAATPPRREYLDHACHEGFDAWRVGVPERVQGPGDDRRVRHWDTRCATPAGARGLIAGWCPEHGAAVLRASSFSPTPTDDEYPHRHAGVLASNRWLKHWCDEFPDRHAGIRAGTGDLRLGIHRPTTQAFTTKVRSDRLTAAPQERDVAFGDDRTPTVGGRPVPVHDAASARGSIFRPETGVDPPS